MLRLGMDRAFNAIILLVGLVTALLPSIYDRTVRPRDSSGVAS